MLASNVDFDSVESQFSLIIVVVLKFTQELGYCRTSVGLVVTGNTQRQSDLCVFVGLARAGESTALLLPMSTLIMRLVWMVLFFG